MLFLTVSIIASTSFQVSRNDREIQCRVHSWWSCTKQYSSYSGSQGKNKTGIEAVVFNAEQSKISYIFALRVKSDFSQVVKMPQIFHKTKPIVCRKPVLVQHSVGRKSKLIFSCYSYSYSVE